MPNNSIYNSNYNNQNSNNKYENNYFITMIHRYNEEDFVWRLRPEQIQKAGKDRIFREMIRGQIDYSKYGKYFLDNRFIDNLIVAANDELNNNCIIYNALNFQDTYQPGNLAVSNLMNRYSNYVYIYQVLVDRLQAVKVTGNVGALIDINLVLGNLYRNYDI